jgi:hypothetical protein
MHKAGWQVGLHQSFNAWAEPELMREQRVQIERALNLPVTSCRQHWLRFSWERTWRAQQEAGLELDCTLGFNDRPGFRNGAALCYSPWDDDIKRPMKLKILPLMLMDSHLYDYLQLTEVQRNEQVRRWLDEIRQVRGAATVVWHQRAWARDYGWDKTYLSLLDYWGEAR